MAEKLENVIPEEEKILGGENANGNDLILYSYHHCFYSQKVMMALHEKNLSFTIKSVDITKGDQYKNWYLKINPKGEVPVLKDGIKYIPDSERIIVYLEDNFSNGKHSRLIPIDQGLEIKQKVINFTKKIDSIPAHIITMGALFHDEYCSNFKYPFVIPSVRNSLKASEKSGGELLKKLSLKNPEFSKILLEKASKRDEIRSLVTDKNVFYKALQDVNDLLDSVEKELSTHSENQSDWWLCTERFTIADISLTVLLDRLSRVGLENYFWAKGKRPNVQQYYKRVQQRDSYKETMPTLISDLSIILRARAPIIIGVSLLTVVFGVFFLFKKKIMAALLRNLFS